MSRIQIRFHEAAREDISEAERYYTSISPTLGREFIAGVDAVLARLRTFPDSGSAYRHGTRRVLLDRFPFSIIHTLDDAGIVIVAVAHNRRKPGFWRDRH